MDIGGWVALAVEPGAAEVSKPLTVGVGAAELGGTFTVEAGGAGLGAATVVAPNDTGLGDALTVKPAAAEVDASPPGEMGKAEVTAPFVVVPPVPPVEAPVTGLLDAVSGGDAVLP